MLPTRLAALVFGAALATTIPCSAPVRSLPIANAGFEEAGDVAPAVSWRVIEGPREAVLRDDSAPGARTGTAALRLHAAQPVSLTVESEEVALEIGKLYRLTARVRTENALSDPTSRYPTAVPACLTMASFPFTNHSPAQGATRDWTRIETLFIATKAKDRVRLHLGRNGTATGTAWFDDITLESVDDVHAFVAPERVRWHGPAYRFDDRGWIFVHVEGKPYERGFQHGALLAVEIVEFAEKLARSENRDAPSAGWDALRFMADAMLLRKYDPELLEEMRGIADGVNLRGPQLFGEDLRLEDIVALNSAIDIDQMRDAVRVTPHALSGEPFFEQQEELAIPDDQHRCSAFVATGPATDDGEIVFGQIFMWGGYTGVHWNVLLDLVPERGHRLAYQTFPGGIHSGADFYVNDAGIVIGETTVAQTPYDASGTPQSDRIRRAAQYASSIDDVTRILLDRNNGMYTNDWPIADVKTGEAAILLLGTARHKLWRTGEELAPFGIPGFLWSNNNNRDPDVRLEYAVQPHDAPYDLGWAPWNRDIAFQEIFREQGGKLDAVGAAKMFATSPINRAHACDGKITTSAMAREMVFLAHHGKVTLREKFPQAGSRRFPDLPEAFPHLSLGYATASPKWLGAKLQEARPTAAKSGPPSEPAKNEDDKKPLDAAAVQERLTIDRDALWGGTLVPASDRETWLTSATAAYWHLLRGLALTDDEPAKRVAHLRRELDAITVRHLYTIAREGDLVPLETEKAWDRYAPYRVPRAKGTFALHQLRLALGNERFLDAMRAAHAAHRDRPVTTEAFLATLSSIAGRDVEPIVRPWLERAGLPQPAVRIDIEKPARKGAQHRVVVTVTQSEPWWPLETAVEVETSKGRTIHPVTLAGPTTRTVLESDEAPTLVRFDPMGDIAVERPWIFTWPNIVDEFHRARIVFGTAREIEAQHTLARRFSETLADAYTETLIPVVKDAELDDETRRNGDLIVMGSALDNGYLMTLPPIPGFEIGRGFFRAHDETYARADQGLYLVVPNPDAPSRVLYLLVANSALQLWRMTTSYRSEVPSWAIFEGDTIVTSGYHAPLGFELRAP